MNETAETAIQTPQKAMVERVPPGTPGAGKGGIIPPKETRIKPGQKMPGAGRPVVSVMERRLAAEKQREERIAELWLNDAQDESDPMVRRAARNDLLDRLIGKPAQAMAITIEEPERPNFNF